MISEKLEKYRISPKNFVGGTMDFVWVWLRSRSPAKLLAGCIPVALSTGLLILFWQAETTTYREELLSRYDVLAKQSLAAGEFDQSDSYFAKSISLAIDKDARSFAVAKAWYNHDIKNRGIEILQTLAPTQRPGYVPAHEFLARHSSSQVEQTDFTRATTLIHEMHAAALEEEPRIRLARFLSDIGDQEKAIDCLDVILNPSPRLRLQRVHVYSRAGKSRAAAQEAAAAEATLRKQLTDHADDDQVRIQLSRAIAFQNQLLNAIFVLADGCQYGATPILADELIKSYVIWLSQMSPEHRHTQMHQIALAFETENNDQSTANLTLRNGTDVAVPYGIAQLHRRVLQGEGSWLIPLLQGTQLASSKDYFGAVERLRHAQELRPDNSLVANNLAWTILQWNIQTREDPEASVKQLDAELKNAWKLANMAVTNYPEEPAYRETRGQISAQLKRWKEATQDLNECITMGHNSAAVQATLKRARDFQ